MNLLFDTNILINLARDYSLTLLQQINPNNDKVFTSVATVAELRSIALHASTAALLGLKLITTDADFDHLDNVFFEVGKFTSAALKTK